MAALTKSSHHGTFAGPSEDFTYRGRISARGHYFLEKNGIIIRIQQRDSKYNQKVTKNHLGLFHCSHINIGRTLRLVRFIIDRKILSAN